MFLDCDIMAKWNAKKSNMNKRVNAYSNPGISEIIYRDEWKRNNQKKSSKYAYIVAAIIIIIFLYLWLIE